MPNQTETIPDYTKMSAGELVTALGTDARKWAQAFCQITGQSDEDTMIGWFANAMMAMHDHGRGPVNGDHAQYLIEKGNSSIEITEGSLKIHSGGRFEMDVGTSDREKP